jgi:hypothetical protein
MAGISLRKISEILAEFDIKICHESARQLIMEPPYAADLLEYYDDAQSITFPHSSKQQDNRIGLSVAQITDLFVFMNGLSNYLEVNDISYLEKSFLNKKRNAFRDGIPFDLNILQFQVMGASFYRCAESSEKLWHKKTSDIGKSGKSVVDICRLRDSGGYTIDNCAFRLKSENIRYARAREAGAGAGAHERTTGNDKNQNFIDETDQAITDQIAMQLRVCSFYPVSRLSNYSASTQKKLARLSKNALFTHLYDDDVCIIVADNNAKGAKSSALSDCEVFTELFEEIYSVNYQQVFFRDRSGMFMQLRKINGQYKPIGLVSNAQQKHFTKTIAAKSR